MFIGAGFWGTSTFIFNLTAFIANSNGDIGTIYCHSSATSANVGRWISPLGLDITNNFTDPFSIQSSSGPGYFSYSTFDLLDPIAQPFTTTYDGVYTCLVPDDQGIMQTLHIGLFSNQYTSKCRSERAILLCFLWGKCSYYIICLWTIL